MERDKVCVSIGVKKLLPLSSSSTLLELFENKMQNLLSVRLTSSMVATPEISSVQGRDDKFDLLLSHK